MRGIRRAAVAGQWYPGTADALRAAVDAHLGAAPRGSASGCPRAIVAPHAGLMYSGPVAAWAYALVESCAYPVCVLVGPSHFVGFTGVSIWPRGAWDMPMGRIPIADDLAQALAEANDVIVEHADAHGREHSLEMQLPFLARLLPGVAIVPLVMGYQDRETAMALGDGLARGIAAYEGARSCRVLIVASSDLSHYEDAARARRLDEVVLEHVERLDPDGLMAALEREPRHACGGGPMVSVLRAARLLGAGEARVLRYADSGDVSGDKSSVVGYMAAAVW